MNPPEAGYTDIMPGTNVFNYWSPLRWAPDYPGLAGKDLSPKGPITECHGSAVAPSAGEAVAIPEEEEY